MQFYVYILCSETTNQIYIGQTNNLKKRLYEHNNPDYHGTLHTKRRKGPWKVAHHETYSTRQEAMAKEKWLKSGVGRRWIKNLLDNTN